MARKTKKLVVHATGSAYLDPGNCTSMISYEINSRKRLTAHIDLTDCNRKITWDFEDGADYCNPLPKIDRAIFLLNSFRTDYIRAREEFKNPSREQAVKMTTIH